MKEDEGWKGCLRMPCAAWGLSSFLKLVSRGFAIGFCFASPRFDNSFGVIVWGDRVDGHPSRERSEAYYFRARHNI